MAKKTTAKSFKKFEEVLARYYPKDAKTAVTTEQIEPKNYGAKLANEIIRKVKININLSRP
jgi:hypothetical protein